MGEGCLLKVSAAGILCCGCSWRGRAVAFACGLWWGEVVVTVGEVDAFGLGKVGGEWEWR